jgi:hypothetical protein
MKLILCIFEQLSGLKINFHKSGLLCFGKAKDMKHQYRQIFGCDSVESHFASKLGCWRSKMLSYGDRLVLINSVLTILPMFLFFYGNPERS